MQESVLFGFGNKDSTFGTFNSSESTYKNKAYVVRSAYEGQPDLLIVAQQVTGGGDVNIRAFYIDDGTLYLIFWQNSYGDEGDIFKFINGSGFKPVEAVGPLQIKTHGWERGPQYSGAVEKVWQWEFPRRTMVTGRESST